MFILICKNNRDAKRAQRLLTLRHAYLVGRKRDNEIVVHAETHERREIMMILRDYDIIVAA